MNSSYSSNSGVRGDVAVVTALDWVALVLLIIGGLNWGLVGAFSFDLVAAIFGEMSIGSRIVYCLVGLSAIYVIFFAMRLASRRKV